MNHEVVTLEPSNLSVIWSKGIYIFLVKELNSMTKIKWKHASNVLFWLKWQNENYSTHYLLCSPEFVPQITGGALFPGAVTLKISVWHCPSSNKFFPPHLFTYTVVVVVSGPVMTKVEKSNLNWQISSLHGQILIRHCPTSWPPDWKYVQFSEDDWPHPSVTESMEIYHYQK